MTEKQWTEGPWKLRPEFSEDHGQYSIEGADGIELTRVEAWMGKHREESRANARLIAAAPELYEALEDIVQTMRAQQRNGIYWDPQTVEAADAALLRARNGEADHG